jgi:hypothetical protein
MPDLLGFDSTSTLLEALSALVTALGLSSASGVRAYLPMLAVAIGSNVPTGTDGAHLVRLSPAFQTLGAPWLIALLVVLVLGEFAIDKIPVLDHISDLAHTIVRPVAGAVVMAGTINPVSERNLWVAAAVGAILALTVHGAKAATRPVVTASTAGLGNPVLSLGEDLVTALLSVLAILAPVLALLFLVVLAILIARPLARGLRWVMRGRRQLQPALQSPQQ